jgi:glyceraldehyde-3-phosphate dehydrogenase/erythrose-4-phosphate dehydrogenase
MANIAINGLGRIGRAALKILEGLSGAKVVAVNDLVPPDNLAYLLRYDTVYGRWPNEWGLACQMIREVFSALGLLAPDLSQGEP